MAPLSIICFNVHIVALLNAVPRSKCDAILLHITLGDSSGFAISTTDICGFFNLKSVASLSVNSLIPEPFLPITMPGRVTCNATLVPIGVFEISACENPASLIATLK